jgi:hypothetical protein
LTTTTKLLPTFVYAIGLFGFVSLARAENPAAPAAPATGVSPALVPAAAAAPPAPVVTAQADPNAPPGGSPAESEPPPEMTFGRGQARAAAPPAAEPPAPAEGPARRTGRARTMEDVSDSSVEELRIRNVRSRYSLNFFGDISMGASKPEGVDQQFGFTLGAQDLLIRGELSNNIVAATEIAFEPSDAGVSVDVERFHIRWQSSQFFVEAGRTHTGFGYWNNAYHHGRWLQPVIARPRWVAFEDSGGLIPVHWVGLGVGARLPVGDATLNLMATMGNGRGHIVDDVRNAHDYQDMKAFHGSVELVGIGRPELRAGVAGIFDKIPGIAARPLLPDQAITELIGSAHIAYVNVPLLFITETYLVVHRAVGHQWTTYGGFALVGYAFGRVTPYVEFERIASRGGPDPFFVNTTLAPDVPSFDTAEGIVGLRVDLSDWTALKAEYRQTRAYDVRTTTYQGLLNWSWGF